MVWWNCRGACAPALGSCQLLAASRGASAAICCNNSYFETVLRRRTGEKKKKKRPLDLRSERWGLERTRGWERDSKEPGPFTPGDGGGGRAAHTLKGGVGGEAAREGGGDKYSRLTFRDPERLIPEILKPAYGGGESSLASARPSSGPFFFPEDGVDFTTRARPSAQSPPAQKAGCTRGSGTFPAGLRRPPFPWLHTGGRVGCAPLPHAGLPGPNCFSLWGCGGEYFKWGHRLLQRLLGREKTGAGKGDGGTRICKPSRKNQRRPGRARGWGWGYPPSQRFLPSRDARPACARSGKRLPAAGRDWSHGAHLTRQDL